MRQERSNSQFQSLVQSGELAQEQSNAEIFEATARLKVANKLWSENTANQYKMVLQHLGLLDPKAPLFIELTPNELEARARMAGGKVVTMAFQYSRALSIIRAAIEEGFLPEALYWQLKSIKRRFRIPVEEKFDPELPTPDVVQHALKYSGLRANEMIGLLLLASSLRANEVLAAKITDLDAVNRGIRVPVRKHERKSFVPLHSKVFDYLISLVNLYYVRGAKIAHGNIGFSLTRLAKGEDLTLKEEALLERPLVPGFVDITKPLNYVSLNKAVLSSTGFSPHDFRRFAITEFVVSMQLNLPIVAAIAGHNYGMVVPNQKLLNSYLKIQLHHVLEEFRSKEDKSFWTKMYFRPARLVLDFASKTQQKKVQELYARLGGN